MATRNEAELHGLYLRVSPNYWLRRLFFNFPFYFENTHPAFRIDVTRKDPTPESAWGGDIAIMIILADGSSTVRKHPVPSLAIGETTQIVMEGIAANKPGRVMLVLPTSGNQYQFLYGYDVRPEEQIWAPIIGSILGILGLIGGVAIQKWLGLL